MRIALNGNMSIINCITPPSLEVTDMYYKKGYDDMRRYFKHGTITERIISSPDEMCIPRAWWHFFRKYQYIDETYNVDIFK